jgi:HSP20 family protein
MASRVRADGLLDELDAIGEQMSRALGLRAATNGGSRGWLPPVDIWETQDELVIEIDAPGCKAEDLAAEVVDNQLVVSGERTLTDAARRYRSERWQGRFVRTFVVPTGVDNANINAEYIAGVLRLRVPQPEQAKPRRIAISGDRDVIDAPPVRERVGATSS